MQKKPPPGWPRSKLKKLKKPLSGLKKTLPLKPGLKKAPAAPPPAAAVKPPDGLEQQLKSLQDKYQYLLAEYANYKKQTAKEIAVLKKYEGRFFIENLLNSVMDDFDQAMKWQPAALKKEEADFKTGMQMIYNRLQKVLQEAGVKALKGEGEPFDSAFYSAVGSAPSPRIPADHILNVLKKAYFLHDKLIRPGVVMTAAPPALKTPPSHPSQTPADLSSPSPDQNKDSKNLSPPDE